MKKRSIIVLIIVAVGLAIAIFVGPVMSNVELPKYEVLSSTDNIEIRNYAPMLIAEVSVTGERKKALSDGFRILADYIFGNNTSDNKIQMTTPVQQESSTKIAMTAPVQQQQFDNSWSVSFIMPSEYSIDSLPKPNNPAIKIKRIPSKQFVVIRFAGSNTSINIDEHESKLRDYTRASNIEVLGTAKYAFYNPPWTLPFMRRNEVMLEIK